MGKKTIKAKQKKPKDTQEQTQLQNDCYAYIADFAKMVFENEERREDSLIQQAGHMQTAFSFVIAALFMVAAIVIEYKGCLTLTFLLIVFSSITACLLVSLFLATMAQNRMKRNDFPTVATINNLVVSQFENFKSHAQRSKYLAETYEKMHTSYAENNDKRLKLVKASMIVFYISLGLCVFWFVVAICKIA